MDYRLKLRECLEAIGVPVRDHNVDTFESFQAAVAAREQRRRERFGALHDDTAVAGSELESDITQPHRSHSDNEIVNGPTKPTAGMP